MKYLLGIILLASAASGLAGDCDSRVAQEKMRLKYQNFSEEAREKASYLQDEIDYSIPNLIFDKVENVFNKKEEIVGFKSVFQHDLGFGCQSFTLKYTCETEEASIKIDPCPEIEASN